MSGETFPELGCFGGGAGGVIWHRTLASPPPASSIPLVLLGGCREWNGPFSKGVIFKKKKVEFFIPQTNSIFSCCLNCLDSFFFEGVGGGFCAVIVILWGESGAERTSERRPVLSDSAASRLHKQNTDPPLTSRLTPTHPVSDLHDLRCPPAPTTTTSSFPSGLTHWACPRSCMCLSVRHAQPRLLHSFLSLS